MCTTKDKSILAKEELNCRIAKNLKWLIREENANISELCRMLSYDGKIKMERSGLSKRLNHPEESRFDIPFLVACADYFRVPVDALLCEDIAVYESNERIGEGYKNLLESSQIVKRKEKNERKDSKFVKDPDSDYFEKYCQKYYCYYYSTVSDENKGADPIMSGELNIFPHDNECKVEMVVDTKSCDAEGNVNYKKYIGTASVSSTTLVMHCDLREENIGEYCCILFRFSRVNFNKQDCRMALVLSTASTPDKRYPIVQRMFLSREKIATEDLRLIIPHLCLNYSSITISEKKLLQLQELSIDHQGAIEELLTTDPELVYVFKEGKIKDVAEKYFEESDRDSF